MIAVVTSMMLVTTAYAVEVSYESSELTVKAEHEPLGEILKEITSVMGGEIIASSDVLNRQVSLFSKGKPSRVLWRLLRQYDGYVVHWSKHGERIQEIRLIKQSQYEGTVSANASSKDPSLEDNEELIDEVIIESPLIEVDDTESLY